MAMAIKPTAPPYYLAFGRHGDKRAIRRRRTAAAGQKLPRLKGRQADKDVELTNRGGIEAVRSGPPFKGVSFRYGLLVGTEKVRTLQSVAFRTPELGLTGRETWPEIEERIKNVTRRMFGNKYGGKVRISQNLNFSYGSDPYKQAVRAAIKEKRLVPFIVGESDRLAAELGDTKSSTYTRGAGGIAREILDYVQAAKNLQRIYSGKPDEVKAKAPPFIPRTLGSHQPVMESFLLKLTEKLEGVAARNELMAQIGAKGFSPLEGYTVAIHPHAEGGEPKIILNYSKTDEHGNVIYSLSHNIPTAVLEEIAGIAKKQRGS